MPPTYRRRNAPIWLVRSADSLWPPGKLTPREISATKSGYYLYIKTSPPRLRTLRQSMDSSRPKPLPKGEGNFSRLLFIAVLAGALSLLIPAPTAAHKPVTSKYDYN